MLVDSFEPPTTLETGYARFRYPDANVFSLIGCAATLLLMHFRAFFSNEPLENPTKISKVHKRDKKKTPKTPRMIPTYLAATCSGLITAQMLSCGAIFDPWNSRSTMTISIILLAPVFSSHLGVPVLLLMA